MTKRDSVLIETNLVGIDFIKLQARVVFPQHMQTLSIASCPRSSLDHLFLLKFQIMLLF